MVPEAEVLKAMQTQTRATTQAMAEKPAVRTAPVVSMSPVVAVTPAKEPAKATPQAMVFDKDGNTVILTLPGGKK